VAGELGVEVGGQGGKPGRGVDVDSNARFNHSLE
jgi:hypothetical protein